MDVTGAPLLVAAAVIVDRGLVLACRRRAGIAAAGRWEFPGGKVEAALVREIREELGVGVTPVRRLTTDDTAFGGRVIRLCCILATLDGDRPAGSTDHDELAWVRPDELPGLDWADPDLPAVHLLARGAVAG